MNKRGRQSAADASRLRTIVVRRPPPPLDLTEFESELWRTIVATMPSDWFRPVHFALLAAYVRHISAHRVLDDQVAAFKPEWIQQNGGLDTFGELLKLRDRETRAMLALARSMRITHQATIRADAAGARGKAAAGATPWDFK